jgi:catechol 2,3-dioxygenase-like lactoylglutathione lyase family enzyme
MSRIAFRRLPLSQLHYSPYLARTATIRLPWSHHRGVAMSSIARTKSLDHLVLTVKDLDATVKFYESVLGMQHTAFTSGGVERHALKFGDQKINLHVSGHEFEPKAQTVQPGSGDLCFLVEDNVDEVAQKLHESGIEVLEGGGVVDRTGAKSKLRSVYIRDPDGNLVE